MTIQVKPNHVPRETHACAEIPEFERLNYFYGQMLGAADFRAEQAYFREKLKLHNRCLHGYGVVCGLKVRPFPEEQCCEPADKPEVDVIKEELTRLNAEADQLKPQLDDPKLDEQQRKDLAEKLRAIAARREELRRMLEERYGRGKDCDHDDSPSIKVLVECGLGLDCHGNELVLRHPVVLDLWSPLKMSEQRKLEEDGRGTIHVGICYCGEPTHPTRPVLPDSCGALADCNYGKQRDSVRFTVSLLEPADDDRCEPCCSCCSDECLVLAKVRWQGAGTIDEDDIDNSVRRPISLYVPTVITGISWQHGRTYSPGDAKKVLGTESDFGRTKGIEVTLSRPVFAETLTRGVVELWRLQGGRGLRGVISAIEGRYVDKPDHGLITSFRYRDESGETLNDGDKILVIIRGDFILDACCRPIDGNHVGGRVPQIAAYAEGPEGGPEIGYAQAHKGVGSDGQDEGNHRLHSGGGKDDHGHDHPQPCLTPPNGIGPWTSGNGTLGGTFEGWFFIGAGVLS